MVWSGRTVRASAWLAAGILLLGLGGCGFRQALTPQKRPMEEFDLQTARPLVLPPSYDLKPPAPGQPAPPASEAAKQSLYGAAPPAQQQQQPATPAPGSSQGENALLQRAGAPQANPNIRDQVNSETTPVTDRGQGMTDRVLDYNKPTEGTATPPSPAQPTTTAPVPATPAPDAQYTTPDEVR